MKSLIRAELSKRWVLFIASLFVSGFGVAFAKSAELGVSPISSVANVLNLRFTSISIGSWLIIWNFILIAGQVLILKRKFQKLQCLQIPLAFIFGAFTDLGMLVVSKIEITSYTMRLGMVLVGAVLLALGVVLSVIADVVLNSAEGFVKAISTQWKMKFENVKICFDIGCVLLAAILSMILLNFTISGIREGTLIAAVLIGNIVKILNQILCRPLKCWLKK